MLRIGVIAATRHPVAEPYAGGMESHTAELTRRLRALGHEVTLFAPEGSAPDLVGPGDELTGLAGPDASPQEVFLRQHQTYVALVLRLRREPDRFDVLHDNAAHYLTLSLADSLPAPVVATLHTPPTTWFESAVTAGPRPRTTFCAVSERGAAAWRQLLGDVPVIRNGINVEAFTPGPGGGTPVWCGRLVPEKGPDHAIAAARRAGTGLVLAGPISDPAFFDAKLAPNFDGDITYAGHLGSRDLATLLGTASAVLFTPRWDEPYGQVAAEALACGTPVAAYDRGAAGELLDAATGRLAPPDDVPALATALVEAAGLDRAAARRRAVVHGSSQRMARAYADLYASLQV